MSLHKSAQNAQPDTDARIAIEKILNRPIPDNDAEEEALVDDILNLIAEQVATARIEALTKWDLTSLTGTYDAAIMVAIQNGGYTVKLPDCSIDIDEEKKTITIKDLIEEADKAYLKGYNTGWQKANRNTGGKPLIKKLSEIMQLAEELRAELAKEGQK